MVDKNDIQAIMDQLDDDCKCQGMVKMDNFIVMELGQFQDRNLNSKFSKN